MKKVYRSITLFITVLLIACFTNTAFAADTISGQFDDGKYTYNTTTKELKLIYNKDDSILYDGNKFQDKKFDSQVFKATTITFSEGFKEIDFTTDEFKSLNSFNFPASVSDISVGSWEGHSREKNYNVNGSNKTYSSVDGVLFNKNQTRLIQFPRGRTGSYTVPSTVKTIGGSAFCYTQLSSITIPESVTDVDWMWFENLDEDPKVKSVTFKGDLPKNADFYNWTATVYYPQGNQTWNLSKKMQYSMYRTAQVQFVGVPSSKKANPISLKTIRKNSSSKNQSFSLGASAQENAALSYKSDNKNVTISSKGKVTIKKGFIGYARITVTAAATKTYGKTSKTVFLIVGPAKVPIKSIKSSGGKITFKISKVTCTGYQFQISTKKDFSSLLGSSAAELGEAMGEYLKYNKNGYVISKPTNWKTGKKTKLVKGKTYYVRVRALKEFSNGNIVFGAWTSKSVKVK